MIPVWKGKPSVTGYGAATVFVDHASHFINISMAKSTGGKEAVEAKQKFERQCLDSDVKVKRYRADNGVYATKHFKAACDAQGQGLSLCGVNAH